MTAVAERLAAPAHELGTFERFYAPYLARFRAEMAVLVDQHADLLNDPERLVEAAVGDLGSELAQRGMRALITAFYGDGQPGDPTSDVAYRRFHDDVAGPGRDALLAAYPDLDQLLADHTTNRARLFREMLDAAAVLRDATDSPFGDLGRIIGASASGSDSHNGGRVVLLVEFETGALAFKPRSLLTDHLVDAVLALVSADLPSELAVRLPRSYQAGPWGGWQEFVLSKGCADEAAVDRYYRRAGVLLAVFAALGTSDLHFENVVAVGEMPMVVDLETVFSPRSPVVGNTVHEAFLRETGTSVLKTLMLPLRFTDAGPNDLDMAALGSTGAQRSSYWTTYTVVDPGTDAIRFDRVSSGMQHSMNLPELHGEHIGAALHVEAIVAGFRAASDALTRRVEALVDLVRSPLYRDLEVRQVLRPTSTYARFLEASTHPSYLARHGGRAELYRKLGDKAAVPALARGVVLDHEVEALLAGDIPYFTTTLTGTALHAATGSVPDVYGAPLVDEVVATIREWVARDRERDEHAIRSSLMTSSDLQGAPHRRSTFGAGVFRDADGATVARRVVDRLDRLAVRDVHGARCTWLSAVEGRENRHVLGPTDLSLYAGGGLVLFLAAAAGRLPGTAALPLLRAVTLDADFWPGCREGHRDVSAFGGAAGSALVLGAVTDVDPSERHAALRDVATSALLGSGRDAVAGDLVGGAAGTATVLARLVAAGDTRFVDDLRGLAAVLRTALHDDAAVHEVAHGHEGLLLAAAAAAGALGDDELTATVRRAVRSSVAAVDLDGMTARQQRSWCKGLPGLLGALTLAQQDIGTPVDEMRSVLEPLLDRLPRLVDTWTGLADDISLCHGTAGEVASLLHVARACELPDVVDLARRRWDAMCAAAVDGYVGGAPGSTGQLGFMAGLTGVAYTGLMLDDPTLPPFYALTAQGITQDGARA